MDTRLALKKNTVLRFFNSDNGICRYSIQEELAREASSIVYNASYINNAGDNKAVRIKECYPFALDIKRCEDGSLQSTDSDKEKFENRKKKMKLAFDLGNELFATSGLTNFTSNTVDMYEQNNTVYIVMTYQEGETLSYNLFSSLKDCIRVVKSTAKVIAKIHNKGYLYLDLKPENIFSLTGTTEVVQLFDFDSLIQLSEVEKDMTECEYKISYTKGFSALELQTGNLKKLGKHTDVYSIGATLFYLVFGRKPTALDCDIDADYDFEISKYAHKTFQDKLYCELSDFFHNTLANYHLDRYQDMNQVVSKLEEIEKLADTTIPYIHQTYISAPKLLVGRTSECLELNRWLCQNNSHVLFITGMGGIGKTTLVRGYFSERTDEYDTIITLNYRHSLKQTIIDDRQFHINAVSQRQQEDVNEYFYRKTAIAKELSKDKKTVLIIDNYMGSDLTGIEDLVNLNWTIIIITRNNLCSSEYDFIEIKAIKNRQDIYLMFEKYLRRAIEQSEYEMIDRIIEHVQGHTLVLELIAKQIKNSYLTIEDAVRLISEKGFLDIAPEKVTYTDNLVPFTDSLKNIIERIFSSTNVAEQKMAVLKAIAYFGTVGITVDLFSMAYDLESKDVINELASDGWIVININTISMHPVIIETMCSRKNTEVFDNVVDSMLIKLKEMFVENKGQMISLCEEFLEHCKAQRFIQELLSFKELLFVLVSSMPRYREQYIIDNAIWLTKNYDNLNGDSVIKLYDMIIENYEEQRKLDKAYEYISQAEAFIKKFDDSHMKGQYYYILVGFYDNKLDGWYTATNKEQAKTFDLLMKSLNKAIGYMKKSRRTDGELLLAEYLRCKANILIRSNPRAKFRISYLLNKVEEIINKYNQEDTELVSSYYLTRAWYYVYVELNEDMLLRYIKQTYDIDAKIIDNDLDMIDSFYVPVANILLESEQEKEAAKCLLQGISLCDKNEEIIPFIRKKIELYTYLLDIYRYIDDEKNYLEVVEIVKELNEQYK